jgi:large subunit ribosomal protein L27
LGHQDFWWTSCIQGNINEQRGSANPGANVYISKDHTLHAKADGSAAEKEITNHTFSILPFIECGFNV